MLSEDEREERAGKTPLINFIFILLTEKQRTGGRGKMRRIWGQFGSDGLRINRSNFLCKTNLLLIERVSVPNNILSSPPNLSLERNQFLKQQKKSHAKMDQKMLRLCACRNEKKAAEKEARIKKGLTISFSFARRRRVLGWPTTEVGLKKINSI